MASHLCESSNKRKTEIERNWNNFIFSDEIILETDQNEQVGIWGWVCREGAGEVNATSGRMSINNFLRQLEEILGPSSPYNFACSDISFVMDYHAGCSSPNVQKWFDNQQRMKLVYQSPVIRNKFPWNEFWTFMASKAVNVFPRNRVMLERLATQHWHAFRNFRFHSIYESLD